MKVCIVTTSFPRSPDDSRGHFIWQQARALVRQGVGVRVVCVHAPGTPHREIMDGVEVIRVRYLWPERLEILQNEGGGLPTIWRKNRLARLAFVPFFLALAWGTVRFSRDCDLIHAHWTLSGMAAWLGRRLHRRTIVLTLHGSDIFVAPQMPVINYLTRAILRRCQHIITNSEALADAGVALGAARQRLDVIPTGIDIETFRPGPEPREPILLFVGSLIERKGLRVLLEALPDVLRQFPGYRLAAIGDGPQRSELEELARTLGLAASVTFLGPRSQIEVSQWMRRARVFVLPSLEEAFGLVLLEALASGTPCVASQVGGIPELVTPGTGLLVPPNVPAALADAICSVLSDPAAWEVMSLRCRQHVVEDCNTWDRMALRTISVYRNLGVEHA